MNTVAHSTRAIARNSFWALLGSMTDRAGALLAMMVFTRLLDKSDFGLLLMALSTMNVLAMVLSVGPSDILTREISRCRRAEPSMISSLVCVCVGWCVVIGLLVVLAIVFWSRPLAQAIGTDPRLADPLAITAPILMLSALGTPLAGALQALDSFWAVSLAYMARGAAGIAGAALLTWQFGLLGAATSLLVAAHAYALVAFLFLWRNPEMHLDGMCRMELRRLGALGWMCLPLILTSVLHVVADWGSQVLLAHGGGRWTDVADLGVARQLSLLLPLFSGALAISSLPVLSATHQENRRQVAATYVKWVLFTQVSAATLGIGAVPLLLPVLYGPRMLSAVPVCRALIASYAIFGIVWTVGPILVSAGRTGWVFGLSALRCTAIMVLSVWLLPRYGVVGIGFSYIAGECLTGVAVVVCHFHAFLETLQHLYRPLAMTAPMCLAALAALFSPPPIALLVAVVGVAAFALMWWIQTPADDRAVVWLAVQHKLRRGAEVGY
jgi:O-antigen/teichoic acid export membrane protein